MDHDSGRTVFAVVGTGLIGQAWSIVFARAGHRVQLWDGDARALSQARALIEGQVADLYAHGLADEPAALLARLDYCASLEQALQGAGYVQENLPERRDVKEDIFTRLDALAAPDTVLASSTSSIPASAFTGGLAGRSRCLVAHPVNPPYLVPVVELCGAPWTAAAALERAAALMRRVGQTPVHVHRELQGFVLNRLQGALLREAFRLVEQGYVDPDGLDATIREGLGLRWAFMGPFETIDLNAPGGLVDYCARYGGLYRDIVAEQADERPWAEALVARLEQARRDLIPAQALPARRRWRDLRLMRLAALKQALARQDPDTSGD
ncbi:3-hydroxyacyl-CoA dehydrogenase [Orrella sp. JC864]|uniref:3-hydroxyacyl-CoA dehydrogenase n=1 Tax=Orrella sp. JC864 TaxID=3120298 RepID=UPI00300B674B